MKRILTLIFSLLLAAPAIPSGIEGKNSIEKQKFVNDSRAHLSNHLNDTQIQACINEFTNQ
jgi:hypothetical protein